MTSRKTIEIKRRPAFEPDNMQREIVQELAGLGATQTIICSFIKVDGKPISQPTLRKHFREELDLGGDLAVVKVAGALFHAAMAGNTTAQIFWLKTRGKGRWNDRQIVELTGPDGEPLAAPLPPSIMVMFEDGPGDVLAKVGVLEVEHDQAHEV